MSSISPWKDGKDDEGDHEERCGDEEADEVEVVQAGVVRHVLLVDAADQHRISVRYVVLN